MSKCNGIYSRFNEFAVFICENIFAFEWQRELKTKLAVEIWKQTRIKVFGFIFYHWYSRHLWQQRKILGGGGASSATVPTVSSMKEFSRTKPILLVKRL